jgi:hypothetical protein
MAAHFDSPSVEGPTIIFYFNAVIKYHGVLYVLSAKGPLTSRETGIFFVERSMKVSKTPLSRAEPLASSIGIWITLCWWTHCSISE